MSYAILKLLLLFLLVIIAINIDINNIYKIIKDIFKYFIFIYLGIPNNMDI